MNGVEQAHAKLSKNAREWFEDFQRSTSSVEALLAVYPPGELRPGRAKPPARGVA
jgi:hypothetical protein